jgi:hypothetical protein
MEKQTQPSSSQFSFDDARSLEELAAQQGVAPIYNFDSLLGKPSPGDESVDEFFAKLREWRREGSLHP